MTVRGKTVTPTPAFNIACLMAYATHIGLNRMAEKSNVTHQQLSTTAGNFIGLETLREANDRIADATTRLSIFRHFEIGEALHSSSDQQKFESAVHTMKRILPLAWQHINFYGRYQFNSATPLVNTTEIAK